MNREEQIEKARELLACGVLSKEACDAIKNDFPQLRESEDERIRNLIYCLIRDRSDNQKLLEHNGVSVDEALAYLERQKEQPKEELVYRLNGLMQDYIKDGKDEEEREHRLKCYQLFWDALEDTEFFQQNEQKEQKVDIDKLRKDIYQSGYNDGYQHGKEDAQKEQKPVKKEITLTNFEEVLNTFLFDFANSPIEDCEPKEYTKKHSAEILKAAYTELNAQLKQDIFEAQQEGRREGYEAAKAEQKPAEWSEDTMDEFTRNIRNLITDKLTVHTKGLDGSEISSTVFIDDKTAKDIASGVLFYVGKEATKNPNREIPEWSEEDEKIANEILDHFNTENAEWFNWFNARFKSLRPQPQRRDTYYDIIHSILDMLKDKDFTQITPGHRVSLLNDIRVKCKIADECAEILDEPSWKPSEEQLLQLRCAISGCSYDIEPLVSLEKQLKQL